MPLNLKARLVLLLLRLLALLPLAWLRALAKLLAWALQKSSLRTVRTIERNLLLCLPELSAVELAKLRQNSLEHTLMSVLELPKLWTRSYAKLRPLILRVQGESLLVDALASGGGVLIGAPHLGAWELLNLYLAEQGELAVLYRAPRVAWLEALLLHVRARTRAVPVRAEPAAVRSLLKRLQAGGAVGILPDQQPKQGEGEFAPFFGQTALTMTLFPKLASRAGHTLFAACLRVPGGFEIVIERAQPQAHSASSLNQNVERMARAHLAQYQWGYKRFSMQPEGSEKLYSGIYRKP